MISDIVSIYGKSVFNEYTTKLGTRSERGTLCSTQAIGKLQMQMEMLHSKLHIITPAVTKVHVILWSFVVLTLMSDII